MGRSRPDQRGRHGDPGAAQRRLALLTAGASAASPDAVAPNDPSEPGDPARHRAPALSSWRRFVGAAADQLPATRVHDADRGLTGHHVTVVALLVAALVTAGAWWVLSGRPQEHAAAPLVHAPAPTTGAVDAGATVGPESADDGGDTGGSDPVGSLGVAPGDGSADASATETIVVDVAGRVRRPGLVTLPTGSRVADALQSAGGAFPKVDTTSLNLARPLVDGEQLVVGAEPAALPDPLPPEAGTVPATPGTPAAPVDLNTATMEQLDALPGVGPVTGQAILDWRAANGGFTSVDELLEVDGIGEVTLADLRDLVTV